MAGCLCANCWIACYMSQRRAPLSIARSVQEIKQLCSQAKVQEAALKAFLKHAGKKG